MTDHPSPLTQRVRRLLGTGGLAPDAEAPSGPASAPPGAPNGHPDALSGRYRSDTGALFESQISRLTHVLRELHAIDRAREAELRQLRERLAFAEATALADLTERLNPLLAQLDALIADAARLLQPTPPTPPTGTLFERMRARAATTDQTRREALVAWATALIDLRTRLAALIDP